MSLSDLHERELDEVFESERQAIRADERDPATLQELSVWESTLADDVD